MKTASTIRQRLRACTSDIPPQPALGYSPLEVFTFTPQGPRYQPALFLWVDIAPSGTNDALGGLLIMHGTNTLKRKTAHFYFHP